MAGKGIFQRTELLLGKTNMDKLAQNWVILFGVGVGVYVFGLSK